MKLIFILVYTAIVLVGGLIGYFVGGSKPSLIASSISTILLLISAWGIYKDAVWGIYLAILVTLALSLFFLSRSYHTHGTVPIVMAVLSFLTFIFMVKK